MKNGRGHASTPNGVFGYADRAWGPFDLDACASEWNHKCGLYYTEKQDGLKQPWIGVVWCNPPWADIGPWVDKSYKETRPGGSARRVVMLMPSRTGQAWFRLASRNATVHWIPGPGRIRFGAPPGEPDGSGGFEDCGYFVFVQPIPSAKELNTWKNQNMSA